VSCPRNTRYFRYFGDRTLTLRIFVQQRQQSWIPTTGFCAPISIFEKSGCSGFKRKFSSLGMTTLGTPSTALRFSIAHFVPISRVVFDSGAGKPLVRNVQGFFQPLIHPSLDATPYRRHFRGIRQTHGRFC
jgi:hypothetical protein